MAVVILHVGTTATALPPPRPTRWRAGPYPAAQSSGCPAARPLCLSGCLSLSLSLWMESLVSVVLKAARLPLPPVLLSARQVLGTPGGFALLRVLSLGP